MVCEMRGGTRLRLSFTDDLAHHLVCVCGSRIYVSNHAISDQIVIVSHDLCTTHYM